MKAEDLNPTVKSNEAMAQPGARSIGAGLPGDPDNEHALIQLPFVAAIEGRQYEGSGLSLVNAFVTGLAAPEIDSNSKIAIFRFPFDGFSVTLPIEVRIETVDRSTGLYKLVFLHPTGPHLPQLRYLLNAFIAGDIVSLDELMRVPPEKTAKAKSKAGGGSHSAGQVAKRILGMALVTAASVGILASVSYGLQKRLFLHDVPALAVVEPVGLSLQTPEAGQLAFVNGEAGKGEVVFSVQTVRGSVLSVENPCDCKIVLSNQGVVGATVFPATPVAFVTNGEGTPILKARVPDQLAKMLLAGATAEAAMPAGETVVMGLRDVEPASKDGPPESVVTLEPVAGSFSDADIGKSIPVRILSRNYIDFTGWISSLWVALTGKSSPS